jgi:hypothetical protein
MEVFSRNMRHFEQFWGFLKTFSVKVWGFYRKYEAFWRHFQRNGGYNKKSAVFSKITRLFEDTFNRIEAFLKWCKAFSNYFQINGGFNNNVGRLKDFEVFWIHVQRNKGFYLEIWGFFKDYEAFKRHFQWNLINLRIL